MPTVRYLVIYINRFDRLNDWMFGFVNVAGGTGMEKEGLETTPVLRLKR